MKKLSKITLGFISLIALTITLAYTPDYFEISKQLDIFTNVFKEVNLHYVDETEPGELMDEALNSMLQSLDPYTNYIPEERVEDFKIHTTGHYGGIGAMIRSYQNKIVITAPYQGFAADKAGLKAGDELIEVDGKSVVGKSTDAVSTVLKGAPGTEVTINYIRQGKNYTQTIEREEVQVKSVPYYGMLANDIGYITLTSFTEKASKEIKAALRELKKENDLKGLVLDLRGNPGGLLIEAVNICNLFIEKGLEVVETKGKQAERSGTYKTLNGPEDLEIPLAILINGGSASASEIVAGTLQDYDRAVIIGQRSFGKGLVQQTRKLSYGAQLKVTIAKYYTPSGRCIQAINYAQRSEDGSVAKLPDSLRTEYNTKAGRSVFDGGGIDPDVNLEEKDISGVMIALFRKMYIFDWATQYTYNHATIAAADAFTLNNNEYQEFVKWLKSQEFDYKTKTEKSIESLVATAEKEEYYEDLKNELDQLKNKYQKEEADDLTHYATEIKSLLEQEIASRYYYQSGRLKKSLVTDTEVQKAVEVLNNPSAYTDILTLAKD